MTDLSEQIAANAQRQATEPPFTDAYWDQVDRIWYGPEGTT